MLGEGAKTAADATRYFDRYLSRSRPSARRRGRSSTTHPDALMERPGLSVKLSAIHPRFEPGKRERTRA